MAGCYVMHANTDSVQCATHMYTCMQSMPNLGGLEACRVLKKYKNLDTQIEFESILEDISLFHQYIGWLVLV